MKAELGDKRLNRLNNIQKVELIKQEILRVHNEIKAEGIYPTLRKILRAMPFHVNESFASELRRELVDDGLIPQPPRGSLEKLSGPPLISAPSLEEIEERKLEINEERFAQMMDDDDEAEEDSCPMTPREASEWARMRYSRAWESVLAISLHRRCWSFLAHPETVELG